MKKCSIPENYIRTITISKEIGGQTIDYTITFTVFGEVLEVHDNFWSEADFHNLPSTAKELMLGKNADEVFRSIKAESVLWAYIFPMIGLGYSKAEGHQALMELRGERPDYRQLDKDKAIKSEWVKAVYKAEGNREIRYQLRFLSRCIAGDFSFKRNSFPFINYFETELMLPPLLTLAICAFDEVNHRGALINLVKNFPNEDTFHFLAAGLNSDNFKSMHSKLIYALNTIINPGLEPLLLSYCEKYQDNQGIDKIKALAEQLHSIEEGAVKEVIAAMLYYERKNAREEAIAILVKESRRIKVGQAKWVDLIMENRALIKEMARLAKKR